jgi:AcrR family transcriptional regulator
MEDSVKRHPVSTARKARRPRAQPAEKPHLGRVAKWPGEVGEMAAKAALGRAADEAPRGSRRKAAATGATATVRRFKQARSERTYHALLDAAAAVFGEVGYDAAQTPDIAREAGVSTGAFYRYFDDKRQVFLEVCTKRLEQAIGEVAAQLQPDRFVGQGSDARTGIDVVLDVLFARMRRDAPIDRVFLMMSMRDPEVATLRTRFETLGVAVLARIIEDVIPRAVVPHPRAAALVVHAAALEVAGYLAGISPSRAPGLAEAQVREALRDMIHRFLYPGS